MQVSHQTKNVKKPLLYPIGENKADEKKLSCLDQNEQKRQGSGDSDLCMFWFCLEHKQAKMKYR